jgi:hypothetical protein
MLFVLAESWNNGFYMREHALHWRLHLALGQCASVLAAAALPASAEPGGLLLQVLGFLLCAIAALPHLRSHRAEVVAGAVITCELNA